MSCVPGTRGLPQEHTAPGLEAQRSLPRGATSNLRLQRGIVTGLTQQDGAGAGSKGRRPQAGQGQGANSGHRRTAM